MKKILKTAVIMLLALVLSLQAFAFSDVDKVTKLGQDVDYLVDKGIIGGYEDGTFRPQGHITRAELCKLINLVFGYKLMAETGFPDVTANIWFYNYAVVAKEAGYIGGYEDGTFRGNNNVTREQFCAIITRTMGLYTLYEVDVSDSVSEWAMPYVEAVLSNSLMVKDEDGSFRAKENITRADVVTVLANYVHAQEEAGNMVVVPQAPDTSNEPEQIVAIRDCIAQITKIYDIFTPEEKLVINPCVEGMKKALYDYETFGAYIDQDYIYEHYLTLIRQAQNAYNDMDKDGHVMLKRKLADNLSVSTLMILNDYFMENSR
ncbi:MAG: S-layer homology domain-containing protein [Clostridia bacterium]|nr:S-layer homology domain-containing protein [Clostridia bacterium]